MATDSEASDSEPEDPTPPKAKRLCQAKISSFFGSPRYVMRGPSMSCDPITECRTQNEVNTQVNEEANEEALPLPADISIASSFADYFDPNDPARFAGRHSFSNDEKLGLLTSKFNCPPNFVFPATSGRRFSLSWTVSRPWLRYSMSSDSAYCLPCLCFASVGTESPFTSTGFNKWKKALGKKNSLLDKHQESEAHKSSDEQACLFMQTRQPGLDVASLMNKGMGIQRVRTKKGIMSIIDVVVALGKRGIAFRGNWDKDTKTEDGNFSFFVDWKSGFDSDLKEHFQHATKNAKYTSPLVQNTIISICEGAIRENILSMFSSYWSVMADETEDLSSMEQVSICIRFVSDGEVFEEFLGFINIAKMDAQTIADALVSTLQKWGLNLSFLVGQGYDGASVMSSSRNGVQAKIAVKYPNATYVHCRSHVLNLAISSSCTDVPSIRNLFDDVGKLTWFLSGSAKRKEIFLEVASDDQDEELLDSLILADEDDDQLSGSMAEIEAGARRRHVPKFCATRWSARVSTLSALMAKYVTVLETMTLIRDRSTKQARSDASSYVRLLEDSQFVVALVITQAVLGFLSSVTLALQAKHCDLAEAYRDATAAKKCIKDARNDDCWEKVWGRIVTLANSINITVQKPRTASIQQHRANAGEVSQTPSDYYRINVYYPFIDHVVEQLETRFSDEHNDIIAAESLIPQSLSKLSGDKIDMIKSYYGKFMSLQEKTGFPVEIAKWKKIYEPIPPRNRPDTARGALSECNMQSFPAINKVLTIFLTIPVGSVSCERSFSALRRLKTWTRSSMTEERLNGLAMLMVHRNTKYIPSIENIYQRKSNWRQIK